MSKSERNKDGALVCKMCYGEAKTDGLICLCNGEGTLHAQLQGYKRKIFDLQMELDKAKQAATEIQEEADWLAEHEVYAEDGLYCLPNGSFYRCKDIKDSPAAKLAQVQVLLRYWKDATLDYRDGDVVGASAKMRDAEDALMRFIQLEGKP